MRVPRVHAAQILASRVSAEKDDNDVSVVSNGSGKAVEAKLPKLELPCFSGEVTIPMWTSFLEQFVAAVDDNCELPDITKFSYLLSLLKSEARMAVQGMSLTAANYRTACDILGKRYGRPERIIFSHIQALLTLSVPRKPSVTDLWRMYDDLQAHVRSLDTLGISGEQYGVVLTPLILTPKLRLEWARDGEEHESDLLFLLDFLQREIERRERSRAFSGEGATAHDSRAFSREGAPTDDGPSTSSPVATRVGVNSTPELDFLANSKSNSGIELELALPSPGGIGIELELPSFESELESELRSSELNSELTSWN